MHDAATELGKGYRLTNQLYDQLGEIALYRRMEN